MLRFSVVRPGLPLTGNAIFPGCSFIKDQAERDRSWPPVGNYILSAAAPSAQYSLGAPPVAPAQQIASVEGAPPIFIERYMSRFYGAIRECGFGTYGKNGMEAPWLEKLGIGEFPKTQSGGVYLTAGLPVQAKGSDDPRFFVFTQLFRPTSEADYHFALKQWLGHDGDVYENIVHGLRSHRLVEDRETQKPLQIEIYGSDFRKPEAPAITQPPFPDLTPANATIAWRVRQ